MDSLKLIFMMTFIFVFEPDIPVLYCCVIWTALLNITACLPFITNDLKFCRKLKSILLDVIGSFPMVMGFYITSTALSTNFP
jgi:hypothetical protein